MQKLEQIQQIKEVGYDRETSLKYTAGQDTFFNIEKVEDGATLEMMARVNSLRNSGPINTVADIGCGSNAGYLQLWEKSSQADTVIGVEPSPHMRSLLQERVVPEIKDKVIITDGDWISTHLEANSVDLVVSRFSLHNIKDIEDGYQELSRILKSGGYAIISLPHPDYCRKELESKGLKALEGTPMEVSVFGTTLHYFYHELEAYLGEGLTRSGLELVESSSLNWGTKDEAEASIHNTLVFTVKKFKVANSQ